MSKNKRRFDIFHVLALFLGILIGLTAVQLPAQIQTASLSTLPQQSMHSVAHVVAVTSDNKGLVGSVDVEINPGRGRVLMNTNPFLEPDTQFSAETAASVAETYTKRKLDDRDIIYSFDIDG